MDTPERENGMDYANPMVVERSTPHTEVIQTATKKKTAAKKTKNPNPINQDAASKLPPGLRKKANGRWEVVTHYCGKKRQIGTFGSREEGDIANKTARSLLKTPEGQRPPDDEIERNVRDAKDAAVRAAMGIKAKLANARVATAAVSDI